MDLIDDPAHEEQLRELIGAVVEEPGETVVLPEESSRAILATILDTRTPARVVTMGSARWIAAASIVLLAATAFYLWRPGPKPPPARGPALITQDIAAPARSRATLTLAGGRQVYLDSAATGALAQQGGARIIKNKAGQVTYEMQVQHPGELLYNTLSNPRGSQPVALMLSDGSKVWLNAESAIRYPAVFTGPDRVVEVSGEAYLEVARNANRPFKVNVNNQEEVEVLGTSLNVNAYEDEQNIKTTLIEGSVAVNIPSVVGVNTNNGKPTVVLKPGQQAQVVGQRTNHGQAPDGDGKIQVRKAVDLEAVLAWKNGRFEFDGIGIQEVMRQVGRWYDVKVEYQGTIKEQHFRGGIPRSADASNVLKLLETTGVVHFTITDTKIIVMPKNK